MAKPFSIQSPEDIAKEYAGNKQRIAQAMQLGVVDPTAGVLAGMFIDRMRSAQMQEQAPQATVAQQVMGGAPATPPPPPSGGLGAAPPVAPPMAPMQPPMPAPGGAPMGMADGGLATLPVPDAMFDEPTNGGFDDGYAGGGLVAFADGGSTLSDPADWGAYIEQMARNVYPNLEVAGRGRTAARNAEVGGVAGSYHLIDAARDLRVPPGMSKSDFIAKLKNTFGPGYDILPSKGNSVHVEPGPALGRLVRAKTPFDPANVSRLRMAEQAPRAAAAPTATAGLAAIPGVPEQMSIEQAFQQATPVYDKLAPAPKREAREALLAYAKEYGSPEAIKKQAEQDKWMTLAQIGFNMAASNSPYLLQAVGAAAAAALPGAKEDKKAREARKREMLRMYAEVEGLDNQDAKERVNGILGVAKTSLDMNDKQITRATDWAKMQAQEQGATERTRMQVAGQKDVANITAGSYAKTAEAQAEVAKRQAMGRASQAALDETVKRFAFPPKGTPDEVAKWEKTRDDFYLQRYNFYLKSEIGGDVGGGAGVGAGGQGGVVTVPWPK